MNSTFVHNKFNATLFAVRPPWLSSKPFIPHWMSDSLPAGSSISRDLGHSSHHPLKSHSGITLTTCSVMQHAVYKVQTKNRSTVCLFVKKIVHLVPIKKSCYYCCSLKKVMISNDQYIRDFCFIEALWSWNLWDTKYSNLFSIKCQKPQLQLLLLLHVILHYITQ